MHERLVEAFLVLGRLPGRIGPERIRCALGAFASPEMLGVDAERSPGEFRWNRPPPSPAQIGRMERALEWCGLYLAEDEQARTCLLAWAHGKAHGRKATAILGHVGLTRADFDAARRRGALTIATALDRARAAVD